jgi:hypothetical protein
VINYCFYFKISKNEREGFAVMVIEGLEKGIK